MKIPAKTPSVVWVARFFMKFRRMREVYWLEAKASATKVIEKVMPMRDIIEPARVANSWRAPSAPTPKRRGHRASQRSPHTASASISTSAATMPSTTASEGTNQKLDRASLKSCLNLFMSHRASCRLKGFPAGACDVPKDNADQG